MIKKDFKFTNFDGEMEEATAWFHITESELSEHLDLKKRFDPLAKHFRQMAEDGTEKTDLTTEQITEILFLVKFLMKLGYGERYASPEGKTRFRKSEQGWQDFVDSGAYDAFVWGLFTKVDEAILFMVDVMPQGLRAEAEQELERSGIPVGVKMPSDRQGKHAPAVEVDSDDTPPANVVGEDGVATTRPARSVAEIEAELMQARRSQIGQDSV